MKLMKINEVVKITGLTKKAIRLYEERALITVCRSENGYRDYSEMDIKLLERFSECYYSVSELLWDQNEKRIEKAP